MLLNAVQEKLRDGHRALAAHAGGSHFDWKFCVHVSGPVEALAVFSVAKRFVALSGHHDNAVVSHGKIFRYI